MRKNQASLGQARRERGGSSFLTKMKMRSSQPMRKLLWLLKWALCRQLLRKRSARGRICPRSYLRSTSSKSRVTLIWSTTSHLWQRSRTISLSFMQDSGSTHLAFLTRAMWSVSTQQLNAHPTQIWTQKSFPVVSTSSRTSRLTPSAWRKWRQSTLRSLDLASL